MKDPVQPQSEDLRFVSAYSVYKGLASGLKSYQDTSGESSRVSRKKAKKRKNQAKKENGTAPTPEAKVVSCEKDTIKQGTAGVPRPSPETSPAMNSSSTSSETAIKKRKRKRNKNKSKASASLNASETVGTTLTLDDSDDDDDAGGPPLAKAMKTVTALPPDQNLVRNPFATTIPPINQKKEVPRKDGKKSTAIPVPSMNQSDSSDTKEKKKKKVKKTLALTNGEGPEEPGTSRTAVNTQKKVGAADGILKNGKASKLSKKKQKKLSSSALEITNGSSGDGIRHEIQIESKVPPEMRVRNIFDSKYVIQDSVSHGKAALDWLVHPLTAEGFMKKYWERQPLLIKRKHDDSEDMYKWILTTQTFDDILRRNSIKYGVNIDITSYDGGVRETLSENLQGRVRPAVVWDYYNNGCSVRMLNPQTYVQQLWRLNASLQEWFGSFVGANVYLTPPSSQGFAPHYDDIEAFILQVEGKKRWQVYAPRTEAEKLPRFSSKNFSEEEEDLGEPVLDVVLEEGDLLYFPRGWIHQANTVNGEHSLHITLSCHQLNSYGDLLKHHLNHALEKLINSDVSFRQGLPTDYLSYMGIAHQNTEDPALISKRNTFSKKIGNMVQKIARESSDFAADAMGKKFIWDSLPPFFTRKERETTVLSDGEFMMEGKVFNRVEFSPETEVKLVRKNCVRLVVEEGSLKLYYSTENPLVYHEQEAQYLELEIGSAPAINHLISQYPNFTKIEDLPLSSNDIGQKVQIIGDLWERGLILTDGPLEATPFDDSDLMGSDESGNDEDVDEEEVESINLSDLEEESNDNELSEDEFYDLSMGEGLGSDSENEEDDTSASEDEELDMMFGRRKDSSADEKQPQGDGFNFWGNDLNESEDSESESSDED